MSDRKSVLNSALPSRECSDGIAPNVLRLVIENKELKQRKQNLKALKILVEQYLKDGKNEAIRKLKTEQ